MLQKDHLLKQARFRVIRQTSQSLNGTAYEAFDNFLETNVTLKEICAKRNKILTATQIEAQKSVISAETKVLTDLTHDSILQVYDYFSEADRHYLVTEFIEGKSFNELLRKGSENFTVLNILKWSNELLGAISYLHSQTVSLVHGSLKPENIILTADGKIKLLPFGISPIAQPKKDSLIAEQEFDAANLHYSPLEQIWTGLDPASRKAILNNYEEKSARILEKPLDEQSDIYSLGATLYHLFTKCLPIDPLERSIDILEGKTDPLITPSKLNPTISSEISEALIKAMEIKRENRFDSALLMQKTLNAALTKLQAQESLKTSKYKDEEDLLEINVGEQKVQKPQNLNVKPKSSDLEAEQKRQFELIKKQLQEAEAQRLKAEQRAVEAEKLLLEKKTKAAPEIAETEIQTLTIEPAVDSPKEPEITEPVREIEPKSAEPDKVLSSAPVQNSADDDQFLFAEPPKDNRLFRRMAVGAVALALLGGAGWGVINFTKSNAVSPNQTISAGEAAKPKTQSEEIPVSAQTNSPTGINEAANNSSIESSNIQTLPETTAAPITAESNPSAETSFQSSRNKPVTPVSQRLPKQTPTPPKIAVAEKKPVTVDDIINDN